MKSSTKTILTLLAIGGLLYANWTVFAPMFVGGNAPTSIPQTVGDSSSVREENGQQIIHIIAKHGYNPSLIAAKANRPTILEFEMQGYDCSAALRIPALKLQQFLSTTGPTRITVPPQPAGTTLTGLCSMGMYKFDVKFS